MKKKIAFILALIMVLCVALTACGEASGPAKQTVTKEALIGAYRTKAEQAKGVSYTIAMDMKLGISLMGQSQNVEMVSETNIESTAEAAHISGTVSTMSAEGTEKETVETYSIKSGDGFDVYINSDGEWYKTHTSISIDGDVQAVLSRQDAAGMQMTEEGNEYVVTGTVSLGEILEAIKNYVGGPGDISGLGVDITSMDFTGVEPAKTTYHFDKTTGEPTGVDVDMADCIKSLMEQLIKQLAGSQLGEGSESLLSGFDLSSFIKIDAEKLTVSVRNIVFDDNIKIELPDGAKNASELPDDIFDGLDEDWEDLEDRYVEDMKISLPADLQKEEYEGYTAVFDSETSAELILREDKGDFVNYADNMDEYLQLVKKANESKGIGDYVYENGRPTFEYDSTSDNMTFRYYTVVYESDEAYWLVQFACEKSLYDAMKPSFNEWADTVIFSH